MTNEQLTEILEQKSNGFNQYRHWNNEDYIVNSHFFGYARKGNIEAKIKCDKSNLTGTGLNKILTMLRKALKECKAQHGQYTPDYITVDVDTGWWNDD